jgi:hypothetical protein
MLIPGVVSRLSWNLVFEPGLPRTATGRIRGRGLFWIPDKFCHWSVQSNCRIPDDWIDNKRYPLFMACEVMRALIEQLQP